MEEMKRRRSRPFSAVDPCVSMHSSVRNGENRGLMLTSGGSLRGEAPLRARNHTRMSATIAHDLARVVRGDVRFDDVSRQIYSTDASIHQIVPLGVVIPRDAEDAHAAVSWCAANGVAMLPRGGGTSLAGQCVGEAVVMDFSQRMDGVLEINAEERWARVQPGLVLDRFNEALRPHGLMFGPDVAPSNRATIGGMIGNNSCGTRSIVYGKTVDHVLDLQVILADGQRATLSPGGNGPLVEKVLDVCRSNADEIRARFPRIMRRVSGYNLDAMLSDAPNLAHMVVGSEGTLCVVESARVNLVARPPVTALLLAQFPGMDEALQGNEIALTHRPSAVEVLDRYLLEMAVKSREYAPALWFMEGAPSEILVIEMSGDDRATVEDRMNAVKSDLGRLGRAFHHAWDEPRKADVWKIRKAGLPLLLSMPGDRKPVAFVEDTAVAPERLAEFVKRFGEVVAEHGTEASFYAHASVGCLHIRPLLNLRSGGDVDRMRRMSEDIFELVVQFDGCMSGEHGDGLSRSMYNERQFGPQLYEAFRQVKRAFDPRGLMNPGKIVDAPTLTEHLRIPSQDRVTVLDFSREGGLSRAVDACNGSAVCRKLGSGAMCPSYMVTKDEEHSTRGRANALRGILSGQVAEDSLTSQRLYEVMDLCVECKSCKSECPSSVDMAKLKFEFLARYNKVHGVGLRSRIFAEAATLGVLGSTTAAISNRILNNTAVRWLLDATLGIDRRRPLPPFAEKTAEKLLASRPAGAGTSTAVAFFPDTFTQFHHPEVALAAVSVLEACGANVTVMHPTCCGRPFISKGMARQAWESARTLTESLILMVEQGSDVVACEPSCVSAVRDDY
ncbi:MAG: FAD-binding protein, partial [Armatimonadetes bacterium]|nr:FAD-binding protein [Armatimonadota bacterium]